MVPEVIFVDTFRYSLGHKGSTSNALAFSVRTENETLATSSFGST